MQIVCIYILTYFQVGLLLIAGLLVTKTGFHYNEGPTLGRSISNFELSLQFATGARQGARL